MLKKMTGNSMNRKDMKEIKGSGEIEEPIIIIFGDWCSCYCYDFCGTKTGMDKIQKEGQIQYRT